MINNFKDFFQFALTIKSKKIAVVQPHNEETILAVVEASKIGLAEFNLIGDEKLINQILKKINCDIVFTIEHAPNSEDAILKSINFIHNSTCDILMKGSIDTSTLMKAVFDTSNKLKTGKIFSDVFIFENSYKEETKLLMITDGGLNLSPDLEAKVGIIQNAVKVANALGNSNPKVAMLGASEKVNPKLPSSIDAAELAKMNREGKIPGCIVEGPMALDVAVNRQSALEKNIVSLVAGNADILVAPTIEAANSLAKSTQYFAGLPHAQVIVGATVPILIPSRADNCEDKLRTIALGIIMSRN